MTKEAADVYVKFEQAENAYLRRMYRNKSHYSLDKGDGIESEASGVSADPSEIWELKQEKEQLYEAICGLPDKQAKRVYAHYFLGISKAEIARIEGVSANAVKDSIRLAVRSLKKYLQKINF